MLMNAEGRVLRYGVMVNGRIIEEKLLSLSHLPTGFDAERDQVVCGKSFVDTEIFVAHNSESGYAVQLQPGWEALHSPSREQAAEPVLVSGPEMIDLTLKHFGRITPDHPDNVVILFQLVDAPPKAEDKKPSLADAIKRFFRS